MSSRSSPDPTDRDGYKNAFERMRKSFDIPDNVTVRMLSEAELREWRFKDVVKRTEIVMSLRHIEWLRFPLPALLVQIISNSGAHISQFLPNAIQSIVGAQMIGSLRNVNIQSDDIYACFTKSTNKVIEGKPWKTFYLSPKKDRTIFTDFDSSHRNWDKYFFAVGGAWYPEYVPQEIFPLARVFIKDFSWPQVSMSSERHSKLTEKWLLHESKENAISIRGVLNSYCMQIMTRLCFVDRVDPGAVRVRSQKGDMTLGKITAACAKQLGAFLKKSPHTPSTLSLTKAEFERACTETFAACAKRQGVPEGKKKEGSGLAAESSPDKSGLSRRSSRIQGRSSTPSDALQIKPLQQVPLPTDALGKRKEREESSSEDLDNGKCISTKLRIPKGSAPTPQGSALAIPKLSPGKLPTGQALSLCKKPRGFAPVGHLPGASSVTPVVGSFLAAGSEGVAHVEGASSSPSKLPGEATGDGVQDGLPMEVKSSAICAKLSEALTSASDLAEGFAVGHKRGSEGRRPSSASRKNKLLEDAFGEGFESADIIPLPVEASKVVEPETIPGGQESGAVKVTSVDSLGVDVSSLLPTASEFHPGDVTAVSPKGTNSFESPSAFLELLMSSAMQTPVYLPSDLGEDDSLFVRPLKTYSSGTGTVALASDSIMVSTLAEGEKPVSPVASAAASAGGEASDRTGVMSEYGPSASNEVMEEMLRISRPHLPTEQSDL
ncbi:uncharacterized protein LOC133830080 isoform X1 [Humulus lupulus]|uniref:uncharacterized protein LOC133830080 isoform X1 n=1 Tax=Humulus lupulus TaxID=3486 RepID=UPI002B4164CE|nr:uncharacterized protein LOC133830080 isoform X1 [Humulus lupulus]